MLFKKNEAIKKPKYKTSSCLLTLVRVGTYKPDIISTKFGVLAFIGC